jgi:mycofactocin precursor
MSEQATTADSRTDAGGPAGDSGPAVPGTETDAEELLIEEISIDGMCGVY